MSGYTKLWNCIIASSIWNEDDKTRIVWITLLALKEKDGVARTSIGSLATLSRVDIESAKRAIDILLSPDPDSRSEEFEGRRIERVDGGFLILNHEKYRDFKNDSDRNEYMKEYMRKRRKEAKEENKTDTYTDTEVKLCKTKVNPVNINNVLPFDSDNFKKAWNDWQKHRKEIKKPLTPLAIGKQLSFLADKSESEAISMIESAIRNGWQGLFEEKKNSASKPKIERDYTKSW